MSSHDTLSINTIDELMPSSCNQMQYTKRFMKRLMGRYYISIRPSAIIIKRMAIEEIPTCAMRKILSPGFWLSIRWRHDAGRIVWLLIAINSLGATGQFHRNCMNHFIGARFVSVPLPPQRRSVRAFGRAAGGASRRWTNRVVVAPWWAAHFNIKCAAAATLIISSHTIEMPLCLQISKFLFWQ